MVSIASMGRQRYIASAQAIFPVVTIAAVSSETAVLLHAELTSVAATQADRDRALRCSMMPAVMMKLWRCTPQSVP